MPNRCMKGLFYIVYLCFFYVALTFSQALLASTSSLQTEAAEGSLSQAAEGSFSQTAEGSSKKPSFKDCIDTLIAGKAEAKGICHQVLDNPNIDLSQQQKTQLYIMLATFYNMESNTDIAHELLDTVAIDNPLLNDANIFRYNWIRTRGILYFEQEDYKRAMDFLLEGLDIAEKMGQERSIGTSANDIASSLMELGEYQRAMEYYQQALDAFTRIDNKYSMATSLAGIGIAHRDLGDFNSAINFLQRAINASQVYVKENPDNVFANTNLFDAKLQLALAHIELEEFELAKPLLQEARAFFANKNRYTDLVDTLTALSQVALFEGGKSRALDLINKAVALENEYSLHSSLLVKRQLTLSLQANNQTDDALEVAKKGLQLSNERRHFVTQLFFSKWLADYYSQQQSYEISQQYLSAYIELYEKHLSEKYDPALADLRSLIEVKQQQKDIEILEKDQTISAIKMQKQRYLILGMAAFGVVLLFVLGLILRQKQRQKIALQREINMHRQALSRFDEIDSFDDEEQQIDDANNLQQQQERTANHASNGSVVTACQQNEVNVALQHSKISTGRLTQIQLQDIFHKQLVELMCLSCDFWEQSTSLTKIELAEKSKIWLVVVDEGRLRTRTLDKYLSYEKLPKRPRWRQVIRTCRFVLIECQLSTQQRDRLNDLLEDTLNTHRQLALLSE